MHVETSQDASNLTLIDEILQMEAIFENQTRQKSEFEKNTEYRLEATVINAVDGGYMKELFTESTIVNELKTYQCGATYNQSILELSSKNTV